MGNRAVITKNMDGIGIYLHWNGGRDSVEAFLEYCKRRKFRTDDDYGMARLTQVIANYFGGDLSIGIDLCRNLDCDNWDNGVYIIDDQFNIVDRLFFEGNEQRQYDLEEMIRDIDKAQPENDRLYKETVTAAASSDEELPF